MKKLSSLLILLFAWTAQATTFYISPSGNDATGNGSIGNPWKTLSKATTAVTTAGNTIHVNAGTYLETVQCFLAAGVNLEGDGVTSVIQSTWPWSYQAALVLDSPEGTFGNQSVSYLKFDGRAETTPRGISVQGRSNVSVHHCTIVDFKEEGIIFSGTLGFTGAAPGIYASGNTFHDNTLANCSQYNGFGTGCLGIGGQMGMQIYKNVITQPNRASGLIGWPIKYFNEGWLKGCRITNNTITKAAFNGNGWNFALELFNFQGLEIDSNNISGSLDFNFQGNRGSYPWVCHIWGNTIGFDQLNTGFFENGLIFEYNTDGALIENNKFRNISAGVSFFCRPSSLTKDVVIINNLFDNVSFRSGAYFIGGFDGGTNNYMIDNLKIQNNTFAGNGTVKPNGAIGLGNCVTGYIKNVDCRNNIFENSVYPAFSINNSATASNIYFGYNNYRGTDQYGIGTNGVFLQNGVPVGYVNERNTTVNPLFVTGTYDLQAGSPLKNAGSDGRDIGFGGVGGIIIPPPPPPTVTPLAVLSTTPADTVTGVNPAAIAVLFNKAISTATVKLKKGTSTIAATVTITGNKLSVVPKTTLALDSAYQIQVTNVTAADATTLASYNLTIVRKAKIYKQ